MRTTKCFTLIHGFSASVLLFSAMTAVSLAHANESETFPYICSNGLVYNVRVESWRPNGFSARGPWHKFQAFCSPSMKSTAACAKDLSRPTQRCFQEFREKDNLRIQNGVLAFWPGKIRHSPSTSWFNLVRMSQRQTQELCAPALKTLNCAKPFTDVARNQQLKCLYDRSSLHNRATGRDCYSALNIKLSMVAEQQRRRLANGQSRVAGR